jgi:hypothetical protein
VSELPAAEDPHQVKKWVVIKVNSVQQYH